MSILKNDDGLTSDELDYFEFIDNCALLGENQDISNGKPSHGLYLIKTMFNLASKKVRLFSGSLKKTSELEMDSSGNGIELYENESIIRSACDFLSRKGTELDIIIQNGVDGGKDNHPLIKAINELKSNGKLRGECSIRELSEDGRGILKNAEFEHHFVVMDESAYRLEIDTEQAKARANFGDGVFAKKLADIFDLVLTHESQLVTNFSAGNEPPSALTA